jgi:hypothetical protein
MGLNMNRPYEHVVGRNIPSFFIQDGVFYYPDGRLMDLKNLPEGYQKTRAKIEVKGTAGDSGDSGDGNKKGPKGPGKKGK